MTSPSWLATYEEDGGLRFRLGRRGDDLIAEWIDLATLVASEDGARHELVFADGVSPSLRRKLERGSARLLLRALAGELGLHGAAVAFDDRAVILVGASGHGKSSLAAALCARGGHLLADDAVALRLDDGVEVEPTESDHWLDEEARASLSLVARTDPAGVMSSKSPISAPPASVSTRACAIVDLSWREGEVRATRRRGVDALAHVLPHVVRFAVDSATRHREELNRLALLVDRVSVYLLERPRRWEALGATVDIIADMCLNKVEER